jgi:threonine synthase
MMEYVSTRGAGAPASAGEAIGRGLAPDGGLYVPRSFPEMGPGDFDGLTTLPEIGARLLAPFFAGDPLADELGAICAEAFTFPIPLRRLDAHTEILELFHGPTAAFKDVGARFLASCLSRMSSDDSSGGRARTVLVATSGDTGSAVAAAFHRKPHVEVVVLYPRGRVSARQEHQLCCWDDNITTLAVRGDFDDCQRLVKEAFADERWRERFRLSSANSINVGRLLPQMVYYAASSLWHWREAGGEAPGYIVPSGNLGNALACLYTQRVGLPVGPVALATNANRTIADFLESGDWEPRPTTPTIASAMDVGAPSNMERARHLVDDDLTQLRRLVEAASFDDDAIRSRIARAARGGEVLCPHTACAAEMRDELRERAGDTRRSWIVVATAHPAKFEGIVEPLVGGEVEVPPNLAELLEREASCETIEPSLDALFEELTDDA